MGKSEGVMGPSRSVRVPTRRVGLLVATLLLTSVNVGMAFEPVDGTTGIPMGGVGAGAVKFCPHLGTFAATAMTPVANVNFSPMKDTCFQFYSRRGSIQVSRDALTSVSVNGRFDDDAFFPVETANFGTVNDVSVHLTAFSPIDLSSLEKMTDPCAYFDLELINKADTDVFVACALQMGTASTPTAIPNEGFTTRGGVEYAVVGASSDPAATISYGHDAGFTAEGRCDNQLSGNTNRLVIGITLKKGEKKDIKFVLAWFNGVPGKPYYENRFHYLNNGTSAGEFAQHALPRFDALEKNALDLTRRMRASNLPDWLKNQTMNTLCNLSNNWVYTKDGRMACAEGQWPFMGTMDQMWHARQIYTMICPEMVWKELEYWARTQKSEPEGQIHHDFCNPPAGNQSLVPWDDKQHQDYREIDGWVDLNCGFIISLYEALIATGDRGKLDYFWPYLSKAGSRIITQNIKYQMTKYPGTFNGSGSTYDAGGNSDAYNSGLAIVAYQIMSRLSALRHDDGLKATYDRAFETARSSFQARWLDSRINNFPYGRITESILTGQQTGYFLKFDSFFPKANLDYGLSVMTETYNPIEGLHYPNGTYDEWAEYILVHLGDLLLQTGHMQEWRTLQNDYYKRCFGDRDIIFDTELGIPALLKTSRYPAASFGGAGQYISNPDLWRNYYDIIGYHRDKLTGELWVEPHIPAELNHELSNALFFSPEGMGKINATESGASFQNQNLMIASDSPIRVSCLYIKDLYGRDVTSVKVDGKSQNFARIGEGYGAHLRVAWTGTVGPQGVRVEAVGDPIRTPETERTAYNPLFAADATTLKDASLGPIHDDGAIVGIDLRNTGSQVGFGLVNFGVGADSIQIRSSGSKEDIKLEVHLDKADGPLVATLPVRQESVSQDWVTAACPVKKSSGIHNLYLVRTGGTDPVQMNWVQFVRKVRPSQSYQAADQIEAENYDVMSGGIGIFPCADATDSRTTTNIKGGDYLGFNDIKLDAATKTFQARASSGTQGGTIEIHLDGPNGQLVGTCKISGTNGWDNWSTSTCPILLGNITGDHSVYLVFKGSSQFLFNLNWFKFLHD